MNNLSPSTTRTTSRQTTSNTIIVLMQLLTLTLKIHHMIMPRGRLPSCRGLSVAVAKSKKRVRTILRIVVPMIISTIYLSTLLLPCFSLIPSPQGLRQRISTQRFLVVLHERQAESTSDTGYMSGVRMIAKTTQLSIFAEIIRVHVFRFRSGRETLSS